MFNDITKQTDPIKKLIQTTVQEQQPTLVKNAEEIAQEIVAIRTNENNTEIKDNRYEELARRCAYNDVIFKRSYVYNDAIFKRSYLYNDVIFKSNIDFL